jgi:hypothetical protein
MSDENKVQDNKPGAKDISLASMIISAAWIGILSLFKMIWNLLFDKAFGLTMGEIISSGVMIAVAFSPVYFSIILDKVKEIKLIGGDK